MANKHKSVAASNYKVSNYIPDDLVFSILSKLPLKSLKRFGSVCKSWSLLFENPNLMNMYRSNFLSKNHDYYNDTSVLLHHKIDDSSYYHQKYALYSLSGDRFENRVKLDWPNPFQDDDDIGFKILGPYSINGILCLCCIFNLDMILWNPATKEFKVIPHSPIESTHNYHCENHIFGYDRIKDDYKVIRHVLFIPYSDGELSGQPIGDKHYDHLCEIYSSRSNTWKKLDNDVPRCLDREHVFMDGVSHSWSHLETHNKASLLSFDFSNETFFITPIPLDIMGGYFGRRLVWKHLMVLNGSIALIVLNHTDTTIFHISILGEVGVKNSWTKLFVVELSPCIEYPVGAWKNGNMFVRKKDGELAWFDLSTHMIEELGIILVRSNCKIIIYKESFLPIEGRCD